MRPGPAARLPPLMALGSPGVLFYRLQELEDQYRREREEATYLLEQQRLVRMPTQNHSALPALAHWESGPVPSLATLSTGPAPLLHSGGLG